MAGERRRARLRVAVGLGASAAAAARGAAAPRAASFATPARASGGPRGAAVAAAVGPRGAAAARGGGGRPLRQACAAVCLGLLGACLGRGPRPAGPRAAAPRRAGVRRRALSDKQRARLREESGGSGLTRNIVGYVGLLLIGKALPDAVFAVLRKAAGIRGAENLDFTMLGLDALLVFVGAGMLYIALVQMDGWTAVLRFLGAEPPETAQAKLSDLKVDAQAEEQPSAKVRSQQQ